MRVLVACEYSGRVRDAFLALGHHAVSCDLLPTDSEGPHHQGDVFDIIGDGWDLMIAHPPCTYLTIAAEWAYKEEQTKKIKPGTLIGAARQAAREEAIKFVMLLANAPIERIAIENPIGVLSSRWREPDQFIQPYEYGDDASKKTCLWLQNLPRLSPTAFTPPVSQSPQTAEVTRFDGAIRQTAGRTRNRRLMTAGRFAARRGWAGPTRWRGNGGACK
jgi:hypothetical protein